jgi:hypothetical protein
MVHRQEDGMGYFYPYPRKSGSSAFAGSAGSDGGTDYGVGDGSGAEATPSNTPVSRFFRTCRQSNTCPFMTT